MNQFILESAAVYVNSYRASCARKGLLCDTNTLRGHIVRLFGEVYAAILIQ